MASGQKSNSNRIMLNYLHAAISGVAALFMFAVILAVFQITPFGDNTFLMFDLKRQYVDHYAYYKTILSGENDIFYSFSTTLGSGISSFVTYYISSPFLLLVSLFPQTGMPLAMTVLIGLKICLAAFIMDLFLQRFLMYQEKIVLISHDSAGLWFGALSWAFSGYLFSNSMNTMWTDIVILFPLLVWSIEDLLCYGKRVLYIVLVALMLLDNYYLTYMALLFAALWILARVFIGRMEKPLIRLVDSFVSTVTAAAIGGIMLVPTAMQLLGSPKDLTSQGLKLEGVNLSVLDVISKFPSMSYDALEMNNGYPMIYCGVLTVILALFYFAGGKAPVRDKITMGLMMFIIIVSFCHDGLNIIWHAAMEPRGFPYRQAYILTFLIVVCAVKGFIDMEKNKRVFSLLLAWAGVTASFILVFRKRYDHITAITKYVNYAVLVVLILLFVLFIRSEKAGSKLAFVTAFLLLFVSMGELGANALDTYRFQRYLATPASEYVQKVGTTQAAVDHIKQGESTFFRMEDLNPRQQNDPMQYNYHGVTYYSSVGIMETRNFLQRIGFNDNYHTLYYGHDNTVLADAILGVKYLLNGDAYDIHPMYENTSYEGMSIKRNPYALPLAVCAGDGDISKYADCTGDPFSLQNKVFELLLGRDFSAFSEPYVTTTEGTDSDGKQYRDYKIKAVSEGELYFYLGDILGKIQSLTIYKDGEFLTGYGNYADLRVLNLGCYRTGEECEIRVVSDDEEPDFGTAYIVTEDVKEIEKAVKELDSSFATVTQKGSSHLDIKCKGAPGLFLTVPYETGWTVHVDGAETEPVKILDSFIYVPLTEGSEHAVTLDFLPEGFAAGNIISVAGLAILVILIVGDHNRKKRWTTE